MGTDTDKEKPDSSFKPHILLFWVCLAGTVTLLAVGVRFFLHYMKYKDDIGGRVVMLRGAAPPAEDAGVDEVREWMAPFSSALPGCRCSLGRSGAGAKDRALLFCVGFSTGRESCRVLPEKMPAGVSIKVSQESDVGAYTKVLFLLSRSASYDIIHPLTNRKLAEPE